MDNIKDPCLHILDVEFNPINGGSFSVTVRKSRDDDTLLPLVKSTLEHENSIGLNTLQPYQDFAKRVSLVKQNLLTFIKKIKSEKKSILALGASTKGNVLLQYCGICSTDIPFIGEVNTEKFNCYTPGSWIPIIPEDDLLSMNPDYVLVLPWHFRNFFEDNIKFKKRIIPGMKFMMECQLHSWRRGIAKCSTQGLIDGVIVTTADWVFTIPEILDKYKPR